MPSTVLYIGHGSLRFITKNGTVVYVDPFFPGDYSKPADIILITHNRPTGVDLSLVTQNDDCLVVLPEEASNNGDFNMFGFKGVSLSSYETLNHHHVRSFGAGYLLIIDDIKVYCAGDTSKTYHMEKFLAELSVDYAFLPIDGETTMSPAEAVECAKVIGTRIAIPIHNDYSVLETLEYSDKGIEEFDFEDKVILKYGEELELEKYNIFNMYL